MSYDSAYWVDTIFKALQLLSSLVGVYLLNYLRWNPKFIIAIAGIVATTAIYLSSITHSFVIFMVLYGVSIGIGTGIILMVPF